MLNNSIFLVLVFIAGAYFEDCMILQEVKDDGYTYINGDLYTLKRLKPNPDENRDETNPLKGNTQ